MQAKKSEAKQAPIQRRMQRLIDAVCHGMVEREETVAVALLAALSGQNTFLYGPPGTAKSLVSRRIASVFETTAYFEHLMNRFSTPEEVFGPVSLKALKEDRFVRKTDSYLPKAQFAFLDEIWKSSPAILNALLTLINERTYKNGDQVEQAPLRALLAASNETPAPNQGLEALYDRFIVRLMVPPVSKVEHFEQLLQRRPGAAEVTVPDDARIQSHEWSAWLEQIHEVTLSPETMTIVRLIREQLVEQQEALGVYVSDRRWQRAAFLMRASAFFNGRATTNHSDALLLQHCLWTQESNHQAVAQIVAKAVQDTGIESGISLAQIDRVKEGVDLEITRDLFHSADVYKTEKHRNGEEVFRIDEQPNSFYYWRRSGSSQPIFLPTKYMKSAEKFHPLDQSGNKIEEITCAFDKQGSCDLVETYRGIRLPFKPQILFHRGDKKDVNERLIAALSDTVLKIKAEFTSVLEIVQARSAKVQAELKSLFVPDDKTQLAVLGMQEQINQLKLRITDCERLEGLCR
ncbi:AAA family ATPase [Massilia sp. YIM B02443]|uniref:AAA family ATPase n=1 Tax=Massilia sp. YIM B02443 TaxID=3050127 RepID=UPI0025B6CEAE|nr:AAA family ATPase [Massilia sp. YIM B02443]MDN4039746.1 AAA family ATPase [Massilia sp. YIM B02443]